MHRSESEAKKPKCLLNNEPIYRSIEKPDHSIPERSASSLRQVAISSLVNLLRWSCPQALAMTCINSVLAAKKFESRFAATWTSNLFRNSSFCVAIPAGHKFELQILAPTHPMACIAELETAMASAPSANAFAKSAGVLKPPVMMSETLPLLLSLFK